jgi:hypothetical protein
MEYIKSRLLRSLNDTLHKDCSPPPKKLIIPAHTLVEDKDEPGWATADVIYVVDCPTEKTHTVSMRFRYDKHGKVNPAYLEYI